MSAWKSIATSLCLLAYVATVEAAPVAGQGTWETTLKARDINGHVVALDSASAAFFYDASLNITWLADMNQSGEMNWYAAKAWAESLTLGSRADWRLPTLVDSDAPGCDYSLVGGTDCGQNVLTVANGHYSEMAHLFYVTLGNLAECAPGGSSPYTCAQQSNYGLKNTAFFRGMMSRYFWYGNDYIAPSTDGAWLFSMVDGAQNGRADKERNLLYAVAVHDGDVLAVSEPQSMALLLTALAGLGIVTRRRRAT